MDTILEILKITLPAALIVGLVYIMLRKQLEVQREDGRQRYRMAKKDITIPAQLQACERMILLTERISPNQLLRDIPEVFTKPAEIQAYLAIMLQKEIEHNATQQLYLPAKVWQALILIRDNMTNEIIILTQQNTVASRTETINNLSSGLQPFDNLLNDLRQTIVEFGQTQIIS